MTIWALIRQASREAVEEYFAPLTPVRLAALLLVIAVCTMGASCGTQNLLTEPLHIRCVGKGETIIQAGPYGGTIKSDCGTGFEYLLERGNPASP